MRKFLPIILSFSLWLIAARAYTEDAFAFDPTRYMLPVVATTVTNGVEYKCLNTEQWKTVQIIARQYHGLFDWKLTIDGVLDAHQDVVDGYDREILHYKDLLKEKNQYIGYLTTRLSDTEKTLSLTRFKGNVENYALWAVIGVETILLAALSVYAYVEVYKAPNN